MLKSIQCSLCVKHSMLNACQMCVFQVFIFNAVSIVCAVGASEESRREGGREAEREREQATTASDGPGGASDGPGGRGAETEAHAITFSLTLTEMLAQQLLAN